MNKPNTNLKFQFTHPGRGATLLRVTLIVCYPFQFTHPGRGATALSMALLEAGVFQFTHPGRGATCRYTTRQGY